MFLMGDEARIFYAMALMGKTETEERVRGFYFLPSGDVVAFDFNAGKLYTDSFQRKVKALEWLNV
ncbi:MAG: hypothetical protein HPY53_01060 [Brevinematales bacterium]|nr:hypothetical protein [Brevinematales bacterium]